MRNVRHILSELKNNNPEAFADTSSDHKDPDSEKVDDTLPPSEIKRLTEAIKRKRLTAPGLDENELKGLMGRIGYGKK
jgi:hypothetical protein